MVKYFNIIIIIYCLYLLIRDLGMCGEIIDGKFQERYFYNAVGKRFFFFLNGNVFVLKGSRINNF